MYRKLCVFFLAEGHSLQTMSRNPQFVIDCSHICIPTVFILSFFYYTKCGLLKILLSFKFHLASLI